MAVSAGGGPGRDPADLNRERAAIREDPELVQERVQRAATVFALTELREPRRSLADAWRIAVGDFSIDAEKATRAARNLKPWARRALAPSLAAHLLAAGVGPERLVEAIVEQIEAVKRKADGSIVCDPDGEPGPGSGDAAACAAVPARHPAHGRLAGEVHERRGRAAATGRRARRCRRGRRPRDTDGGEVGVRITPASWRRRPSAGCATWERRWPALDARLRAQHMTTEDLRHGTIC